LGTDSKARQAIRAQLLWGHLSRVITLTRAEGRRGRRANILEAKSEEVLREGDVGVIERKCERGNGKDIKSIQHHREGHGKQRDGVFGGLDETLPTNRWVSKEEGETREGGLQGEREASLQRN
jgi:hypothetical protein